MENPNQIEYNIRSVDRLLVPVSNNYMFMFPQFDSQILRIASLLGENTSPSKLLSSLYQDVL